MRKSIKRSDQHYHGEQFIHVARHRQGDEGERMLQPVSAPAKIGEFIDEVEKRK